MYCHPCWMGKCSFSLRQPGSHWRLPVLQRDYLEELGKKRGCFKNTGVICWYSGFQTICPPSSSRQRQAKTIWDSASSHKIDYAAQVLTPIVMSKYQWISNSITGLRVRAIFMNGEVCPFWYKCESLLPPSDYVLQLVEIFHIYRSYRETPFPIKYEFILKVSLLISS